MTKSWREFFLTYWKLIYTVAIRAGLTDAEAQDVVQETVIGVARKMPEFRYEPGKDSFKGWLLQLTRWKIGDQFRKRPPLGAHSSTTSGKMSLMERIPDTKGSVLEAVWDEEWQRNLLKQALKRLKGQVSPQHYEVFVLYVIRKLPPQQVAESAGLKVDQVYLIKHRLSDLLKEEIRRLETKLI